MKALLRSSTQELPQQMLTSLGICSGWGSHNFSTYVQELEHEWAQSNWHACVSALSQALLAARLVELALRGAQPPSLLEQVRQERGHERVLLALTERPLDFLPLPQRKQLYSDIHHYLFTTGTFGPGGLFDAARMRPGQPGALLSGLLRHYPWVR